MNKINFIDLNRNRFKNVKFDDQISQDFQKVEIRIGRIVEVENFPEARLPAYKLKIDFGEFGIKK